MKNITAIICALVLLVMPLSSCGSNDDVPNGMIAAYADGEPFKLYVPEEMTSNVQSGISGAFAYVPEKMMITARYYTPSSEMTVQEYLNYCANDYAESLGEFNMTSMDATVLAGKNAYKMIYTAKIDKVDYTCTQIVTLHNGDMVSLNFYIPTESVETCQSFFENTVKEFVLCDRPEHVGDEVIDKNTPDGMKIASDDGIEYRLYVPLSWICQSDSGKSEAYYPESERSNVNLTSYSPTKAMTLDEYMSLCKESYADSLSDYALIEESEAKMAGKDARSIVYSVKYDGVEYKIKQVCVFYSEMFYTLTYTAVADSFDLHIDDVDRMISEFTFR